MPCLSNPPEFERPNKTWQQVQMQCL